MSRKFDPDTHSDERFRYPSEQALMNAVYALLASVLQVYYEATMEETEWLF